jgi:Fe2+ or Zn2+ uptake regulation protein
MLVIDNIEVYLRSHGISPSYQRKRIFEYLYENDTHPTVSQIYEQLVPEIPTLSKTTVYNTLNKFIEKNIVDSITIDSNEIRYEITSPKTHGHFKCDLCTKVYDIHIDSLDLKLQDLENFDVHNKYVYFTGICKNCR